MFNSGLGAQSYRQPAKQTQPPTNLSQSVLVSSDSIPQTKTLNRNSQPTEKKSAADPPQPAETVNLKFDISKYISKDQVNDMLNSISALIEQSDTAKAYFRQGRDKYKIYFGEDLRAFYIGAMVFGLLFFFFILQPLMWFVRLGLFGFILYSCHNQSTALMGNTPNANNLANVGVLLLGFYLFKYLI
jgi:hypothetical protein